MDPSSRKNKKPLIAMVSWTHLVEKTKKPLIAMVSWTISLAYIYRGKNANGNSLTYPSYTVNFYPSYVMTVLQKIN
jgi:hypothetical protein